MNRPENNFQAIEVDDYYDKIHQATWSRRSASMMAGATLGSAYGGVIGAIAAFIPAILGTLGVAGAVTAALPELAVVATSAGILAAIGGLMGVAAVATVGADSAAIASGLTEKEKREKLDKLKDSSPLSVPVNPDVSIKELPDQFPKPFKWRTALFTVPLFAAFGTLIASNPVTAPLVALATGPLALAANSPAVIAASAGIFGMFGAIFATSQSYYTNKVANFYLKVLKDKIFTGHEEKALASHAGMQPQHQAEPAITPEAPAIAEPAQSGKQFSSEKLRFSMQGLIEKTEEHPVETHLLGR